jgi:hypothetical protein
MEAKGLYTMAVKVLDEVKNRREKASEQIVQYMWKWSTCGERSQAKSDRKINSNISNIKTRSRKNIPTKGAGAAEQEIWSHSRTTAKSAASSHAQPQLQ